MRACYPNKHASEEGRFHHHHIPRSLCGPIFFSGREKVLTSNGTVPNNVSPTHHCLPTLNPHISDTTPKNAKTKGYELNMGRMRGPPTSFPLVTLTGHDTRISSNRLRGPHHKRKGTKGIDKFVSLECPEGNPGRDSTAS